LQGRSSLWLNYRVAITGSNLQYLAPRLTVRQVETEIGPPEAVTTQVIQSERDRRPVALTLHSYANGAIIFAESDWMPPGLIDRVILDVPVVSAIVFRGDNEDLFPFRGALSLFKPCPLRCCGACVRRSGRSFGSDPRRYRH